MSAPPSPYSLISTQTPEPAVLTLYAPSSAVEVDTRRPVFTWSAYPGATHYRLIVRRPGAEQARINLRVRALAGDVVLSVSGWQAFRIAPRNLCPGPGDEGCISPVPSATRTPSRTPTRTATAPPTATPRPATATRTPSRTPSRTPTRTPSPTGGVCTISTVAPTRTPCFSITGNCPVEAPPSLDDLRGLPDTGDCLILGTPTFTRTPTRTPTLMPACIIEAPGTVNVRSNNASTATRIGQLYVSQRIQASAQENGWYQLFVNGVSHWVNQSVVNVVSGNCANLPGRLAAAPTTPLNDDFYCFETLMPVAFYTYCEKTVLGSAKPVYDGFIQRIGREPSLAEMFAVTIQTEWWAYRQEKDGLVKSYGTEGVARAYYHSCGVGSCNIVRKIWFLSSYQPWLTGNKGVTAAVNELQAAYNAILPQLSVSNSEMSQTVNAIISASDPRWRDGKIANRPWQWFNCDSFASRETEGTDAFTQVLLRIRSIPFEMYTAAQHDSLNRAVECN